MTFTTSPFARALALTSSSPLLSIRPKLLLTDRALLDKAARTNFGVCIGARDLAKRGDLEAAAIIDGQMGFQATCGLPHARCGGVDLSWSAGQRFGARTDVDVARVLDCKVRRAQPMGRIIIADRGSARTKRIG